jgi:hypothetical protein
MAVRCGTARGGETLPQISVGRAGASPGNGTRTAPPGAAYSDGMDADFLAALPAALEGCRYSPEALSARIAAIPCETELQKQMLNGLLALFSGAQTGTEEP